jgi:hypothetical protein
MLTPDQIAEGRALVAAATPGPWDCPDEGQFDGRRSLYSKDDNHLANAGLGPYPTHSLHAGDGWHGASYTLAHPADAELIVYLRNNASALLDAADELAKYKAALRQFASLACATGNTIIAEKILQEHNLDVK